MTAARFLALLLASCAGSPSGESSTEPGSQTATKPARKCSGGCVEEAICQDTDSCRCVEGAFSCWNQTHSVGDVVCFTDTTGMGCPAGASDEAKKGVDAVVPGYSNNTSCGSMTGKGAQKASDGTSMCCYVQNWSPCPGRVLLAADGLRIASATPGDTWA